MTTQMVEVAELLAPCEKTPKVTREFFLNPPDWRYQEASRYIHDEDHDRVPEAPTDASVLTAIRVLKALREPEKRNYLYRLQPQLSEAFYLGIHAKDSPLTAEMEAYLIHGYTARRASEDSGCINQRIYSAYAKFFFDLSGITAAHAWLDHFLFEPGRYSGSSKGLRNRILAYFGNLNTARETLVTGGASKESQELMKKIINNERLKRVFDYMVSKVSLDQEHYADIMEATMKGMSDREFQEHMRDREEAGSASLAEFAEHLEEGIRAYSQSELEKPDDTGLDFVNQYKAVILKKET